MCQIFHKALHDCSEKEIQILFNHMQSVYEKLKEHCVVAKPLSCDQSGINYSYIDVPQESLSEALQQQTCTPSMMQQVGKILATLHTPPTVLHSDFVPHNLFYKDNHFFVIDAHPPEFLGYRTDLLFGDKQRDIVAFVTCIFSNVGLAAVWAHKHYYKDMALNFLEGYCFKLSLPSSFFKSVFTHACDTYRMKRKAKICAGRAFSHALLYAIVALFILGCFQCKQQKP